MPSLKHVNPLAAFRDLRAFLTTRSRGELIAGIGAVLVSGGLMTMFLLEAQARPRPPEREITYVQDWSLERSVEQIRAQNALNAREKAARDAELERLRAKRREEFKRLDDRLKAIGI